MRKLVNFLKFGMRERLQFERSNFKIFVHFDTYSI